MVLISFNFCFAQTEIQNKTLCHYAVELTRQNVVYDASYFAIDYPNGDVPSDKGVCTDVIVRAYRMGIDLQKEVHEDMKMNFGQ